MAPGEGTVPVDEEIVAAVAGVARQLGARPYRGAALAEGNDLFGTLRSVETHTDIEELGTGFGANITAMLADGRDVDRRSVERLWARRSELVHRLLGEMGDVLVLPVARFRRRRSAKNCSTSVGSRSRGSGPGELPRDQCDGSAIRRRSGGNHEVGLPIGVQVVARPWCEHVALAVAARL